MFKGVPRALLGHQVTQQHMRPEFPAATPPDYLALTQRCWDRSPSRRPTFESIVTALQAMRQAQPALTLPLGTYAAGLTATAQVCRVCMFVGGGQRAGLGGGKWQDVGGACCK